MNRFYVYVFLREDRYTPYYVGKGTGRRCFVKRNGTNPPRDRDRIVKVKENLSEEESFELEKLLIKFWGRKDNNTGILHNLTDGGDGVSGRVVSEEEIRTKKKNKGGYKLSLETRERMRQRMLRDNPMSNPVSRNKLSKPKPAGFREKVSKNQKGKVLTQETKDKISQSLKEYNKKRRS